MKRAHSQFANRAIGEREASYIFKSARPQREQQKELIYELVDSTFQQFTGKQEQMFCTIQQTLNGQLQDIETLERQFDEVATEHQDIRRHIHKMTSDGFFLDVENVANEIQRLQSSCDASTVQVDQILGQTMNITQLVGKSYAVLVRCQEMVNALKYEVNKLHM